jgi:MoaA/NifB/PqqE/SkfB family radical SAM enzyme|tara:strand:+ start:570 stop:1160 length:591 start_codon:yes stop_codon:yes gene_type:complete
MWNKNTIEWIDIELTSFCNIKCPGCLRQEMYDKVGPLLNKSYIKFEDLKKWIPKGYLPNLKIINFCGSVDEPTTHPEFIDIVDYFLDFSDVNVATNGSTRTIKFWEDLGRRKLSVFFGLDGTDQKSLEKYRIGSNFKKVQENYRAFIGAGGNATWQFIVFDHNEHLIKEAENMSKVEGFKKFRKIYSHRTGSGEVK